LSRAETCSCTLGSNVNTPLPSNKISCVTQEHTLYSNAVYTSTEHEDNTETLKHWITRTTAIITLDAIKHVWA